MGNPSLSKIDTSKERPAAIASSARQVAPAPLTRQAATTDGSIKADSSARAYIFAWAMALVFYVLEYSTRSAPGAMIPQLERAFSSDGVGVGNILGTYYYTYSITSLVAGLALDRYGAKYVVAIGSSVLGIGCLLFILSYSETAYLARLLQGAGSAFAFTGAVYLASHGFSSTSLATAIGVTQSLGMLGGSAGEFVVGPLMQTGINWQVVWVFIGIAALAVSVGLVLITPQQMQPSATGPRQSVFGPYWVVLRNPQSYYCGLVSGLLFAPTTIGAMTWGVAFLEADRQFAYQAAVLAASAVPLGWAFGCPLMGWAADAIRLRKPVLFAGMALMAVAIAQLSFVPDLLPAAVTLFIFGIAQGSP
jgi:MFS family permease